MNYYEHWLGDYAKKTAKLRLADHGAYRLLLDEYYANEVPLSPDYDDLYHVCRAVTKPEQEAVRKVADGFFPIGPDGLRHNERADQEIAKARPRIEAARSNGKNGGRPKNPPGNPMGNPPASPQEPPGNPSGSPPATHAGEALPHAPHPTPQGQKRGPRKRVPETPLPDAFGISERVRRWAEEKGHAHLAERLEHFVGKAKAKGYTYVDWDEALMGAIRDDWAELNGKASGAIAKLTPTGQKTAAALNRWLEEEPHGTS